MPLIRYDDKLLVRDGELATDQLCCCSPCACFYGKTAEVVLSGVSDGVRTDCEMADNTYLATLAGTALPATSCCYNGGAVGTSFGVQIRIVYNSLLDGETFQIVVHTATVIIPREHIRWALYGDNAKNAIQQLCNGDQVTLSYIGPIQNASSNRHNLACNNGLDGTPPLNPACTGGTAKVRIV